MDLWRDEGRVGDKQLLDAKLVRKALTPGPQANLGSSGLPNVRPSYGYLMQLWTPIANAQPRNKLVAFGHGGSDGTHAWVFPEYNATVMYFTQSRGTMTGLRVEAALGELFLGVPFDPSHKPSPPMEEYLGYYWEGEGDLYRAIIRDGDDMALEIVGKGVVPLTYMGEDRWNLRPNPGVVLAFDRSDDGEVTGYHIGNHQEFRFKPSDKLPGGKELAARVAKAHRMDLLESLESIRMTGTLTMEKLKIKGDTTTLLAWPNRFREDSTVAGQFERLGFDGKIAWYASKMKPLAALEGPRADQQRFVSPVVRFGDWHRWYQKLQVIQRLKSGSGDEVFVVRTGDTSATASTLYVAAKTGRVFREEKVIHVDMLGRIGLKSTFGDFRDVSGMLLPFETKIELANPLLGPVVTRVTEVKVGVELPKGVFELKD